MTDCPLCDEYTAIARYAWFAFTVADAWEMCEHFQECPEFQARMAAAREQVEAAREDPSAWRLAETWLQESEVKDG